MIYKVTFEKYMIIEADSKEEAEEKALDEDFIECNETITKITKDRYYD